MRSLCHVFHILSRLKFSWIGPKTYSTGQRIQTAISSLPISGCKFLPIAFVPTIQAVKATTFHDISSAKHLDSPEEQLHSLAGSFGYVAPEVLHKKGHGKAVDMWSIG